MVYEGALKLISHAKTTKKTN